MVIAGTLAATDMMRRGAAPPGLDPKTFYAVPIGHMLMFSALMAEPVLRARDAVCSALENRELTEVSEKSRAAICRVLNLHERRNQQG